MFVSIPERELAADAAEARLVARYGRVSLAGPVHMREASTGDERFTIHRLHLSSAVLATVEPRELVVGVASHDFRWSTRRAAGALGSAPAVFAADQAFTTTGADNGYLLNVSFAAAPLAAMHRAVYGSDLDLGFDSPESSDPDAARHWCSLVSALSATSLSHDVLRGHAYRALALQLFESFHLTRPTAPRNQAVRFRSRRYRDAVAFVALHAHESIGVPEVAASVAVPVSELRRLFLAYAPNGASPEQHLRTARLEQARQELLHGDITTTTIPALARRWGFPHSGTFVRLFLQAFGVMPSDLLDRRRR